METALIGFAVLLVLCFIGFPLGFGMIAVGITGFALVRGWTGAFAMGGQQILDVATNYGLTVLPLFVLMGEFIHRARLSQDLYDAGHAWLGHRPGGLAMATITACGGFAAVCGSSLATAATMAKVSMASMRRYRYADSLSTGSVAAGGTLGILIPPSVPLVIFGIITETDIGQLFIAGILPGLLLMAFFMLAILVQTAIDPRLGPRAERLPWAARWRLLGRIWGVLVLFVIVLGGIYLGVFTPTEAAGIGATGAFLFALSRGRMRWADFTGALVDSAMTTAMIFAVTFGALIFANFINVAGMPGALVVWIEQLQVSPLGVVAAMCLIYVLMGCVFDSLGMLLLTVPVFFPIIKTLGLDPVWFGIVVVIVVEIGLITPPVGMNVFVVKAVVGDVPLWTIFRGITPFVVANLLCLALVLVFPEIAIWLPTLM